jgi:nitrogen-specific signal transduction histidine kinase
MAAHGHRRQVLLFLVAIILPCVVLVVLGLRMVQQERELSEKRRADERSRLTGQLRQELSQRLERIALEEAAALLTSPDRPAPRRYANPAVVFVGRATAGSLALPWESDPRSARFRQLLAADDFASLVSSGEQLEIVSRQPDDAIGAYGRALAAARDSAQAAYARLLRGRAALAAGRRSPALEDLAYVLDASRDLVDEHGVPLALYAASRLLSAGSHGDAVRGRARDMLDDPAWLSPTALYLLRDLAQSLRSSDTTEAESRVAQLAAHIATRLECAEQLGALARDYPRLGLGADGPRMHQPGARWVLYGTPPWMIGRAARLSGEEDVVLVVWADSLFATVEQAVFGSSGLTGQLTVAGDTQSGETLGATFPGVSLQFDSSPDGVGGGRDERRWFYLAAVVLVLSVTSFGAYFAAQDVRRELRLAELRSRFVSAVSHELKTPLTAIRMFAETLQLGRSSSAETQAEYLETIVNESERLTRLLNNVLDFSKIERGRREYHRKPDELAEIVHASARAMRYPLEQQQFVLNVEVEDGLPPATVDRDAIEQAILNLLANAMKYSGDSREIRLRLQWEDGRAVIEVADSGVGIEPDEQAKIFQQFYRVPSRDNEEVPGTGLGLTLVRHIAEGHGGRVTVDSAPGRGSTFAIHLPLGDGTL